MAFQTMTLNEIDERMGGKKPDREARQGVFTGCNFGFTVNYMGQSWDTVDLEKLILMQYGMRDVGFETPQAFHYYFINTWTRNILTLTQNLKNAPDISLDEESFESTESASTTGESNANYNGENKFTNTPNTYTDEKPYESLATLDKNGSTSYAKSMANNDKKNTYTRSGNTFEKWLDISDRNRNIIYDFIDKFEPLFLQTVTIRNFNTITRRFY